MTLTPRANLVNAVTKTTAALIAAGIVSADVIKARDPREPGKERKEAYEDALILALARYWRRQAREIRKLLGEYYPERKTTVAPPITWFDTAFDDDEGMARLLVLLQQAAQDGVLLFSELVNLQIDYTLVNSQAADWARTYGYELVNGINQTSRDALQRAVSGFVETPGMTIGDVMKLLPYTETRAAMVAVTEITRAYSTATELAGKELQREFPGVRVIKRWYTNQDDRVCEICAPLHNQVVSIDEGFTTEDDKSLGIPSPPAHPNCRCWISTTTALAEL
jgi:hypothetical protein